MRSLFRDLLGIGVREAQTRKTIDAAAVIAEARVHVNEIRGNLDRIEALMRSLPDPRG